MAKRARTKQAKRAGKPKAAKKQARKAPPRKPRATQPDLPGVDRPKDRVLDGICARISDHRLTINEAKQAEDTDKGKALDRMKKTGIEAYTAHGVELVHTTLDKLRVRLVDDANAGADEDADEVKGEQGDLGDVEEKPANGTEG